MILLTHNYFSAAIGMASEIKIILPEGAAKRTVFLLSPEGSSGSSWTTSTKAAALSDTEQTAFVIVPSLQGCYTDMVYGYPFFASLRESISYLRKNIPGVPLPDHRCYAAGISSGGLAALRLAMSMPDLFAGAASFSGRLDITAEPEGWFTEKRLLCLYGDTSQRDALQKEFEQQCMKVSGQKFYLYTGTEDPYASSCSRIEELLGARAVSEHREGRSNWKTWSDWLGNYLNAIGGDGDVND